MTRQQRDVRRTGRRGAPAIGRRRLLTGAAALGGAYLLGSQANRRALGAPEDFPIGHTSIEMETNTSANAWQRAARGEQVQLRPPPPPPPVNRWQPGQFITHVDVEGRRMALTFDDGPSPSNTPRLLTHLRNYGVKATFYVVGVNIRSFPDLTRQIYEEGHELGNHSMYHTPYSASALASQMAPSQTIIRDVTGFTPVTSRAPGLTKGNIILTTARSLGLYEAHTHMQTFDWIAPRYSASSIYSQFVRHHRNGALALYHDGGSRRPTPDAIPSIIEYGRSIGYEFVTATELVNSGIPRPGTFSFFTSSQLESRSADQSSGGSTAADVQPYRYDAAAGLTSILDEGSLTYVERMRVVESLAELESLETD